MTRAVKKQTKAMRFVDNYLGRDQLVFLTRRQSNCVVTLFSDTTQFELRCDESYYVVSKIEIGHDANNCVVSHG